MDSVGLAVESSVRRAYAEANHGDARRTVSFTDESVNVIAHMGIEATEVQVERLPADIELIGHTGGAAWTPFACTCAPFAVHRIMPSRDSTFTRP